MDPRPRTTFRPPAISCPAPPHIPPPQSTPAAMAERRAKADLERLLMEKHAGHDENHPRRHYRTNPHD